ncbi:MAG: DUF134 domain-containing protein [Candidatus Marinimicrobia bacterium]|nr:DUF134 domain-containing protein [Candidatus Neomarinimicrobiota bacterium]MCF7840959.1 DUF134 domain-containing protein [Candidatus Neomarinimicrobiota bacterium]MCF7902457.1 DUF134 domain-containing protein [Candidatus Neomarinimicrobiota bacterium]
MSRPRKIRQVQFPPRYDSFKPCGIPTQELVQIELTLDEYEALRLVDEQQLDHETTAAIMGVSRPTVTRLVESAHNKVARMLVRGGMLVIQGGDYQLNGHLYRCPKCRIFQERLQKLRPASHPCPQCKESNLVEISLPAVQA